MPARTDVGADGPGSVGAVSLPDLAMRRLGSQRAILAFAAGVIVIAGVLAVVLSRRSWRRTGDDGTPVQLVIGELPAGAIGCQPHEPLPAGTRAMRLRATPAGRGSVAVRVVLREAGRYSGTGEVGTSASGGTVVAALPYPLAGAVVSLCVWNTGTPPWRLPAPRRVRPTS